MRWRHDAIGGHSCRGMGGGSEGPHEAELQVAFRKGDRPRGLRIHGGYKIPRGESQGGAVSWNKIGEGLSAAWHKV
ncbi:MAG TPA: hypothetical protein V6D05_07390, partial [Stenomitos sp.]